MYKKLANSILILVFGLLVRAASADITTDLVAWWALDDGSGTMAKDSASHPGGPHDGMLQNGPQWERADVKVGTGALKLDGLDDRIVVDSFDLEGSGITIAAWIKPSDLAAMNDPRIVSKAQGGGTSDHYWAMVLSGTGENNLEFRLRTDTGAPTRRTSPEGNDMQADEWAHIAVTWDASDPFMRLYKNGEEIDSVSKSGTAVGVGPGVRVGVSNQSVSAGADSMDRPFPGILDDVRVYERGLTAEDITELFGWQGTPVPSTMASNPVPPDGTLIEDTWVNLEWSSGEFAVSHDIFIGDNFDDVNNGAEATFVGNQTDTFIVVGFPGFPFPDGLEPGTTYYWRIDEVNDAEPNSPWKGNIWNFSAPPKTAYFPDPADGAETVSVDAQLSWTGGFGSKLHTVYLGETFEELENATGGQVQGTTTFTPGALKMAKTYYWRVDEFDIVETHKGDVWSFITEGSVSNPNPAKDAVDVSHSPILTWIPGIFADTYQLYFGNDPTSLEMRVSSDLGDESFEPGQLEWNTTYFWRVDEANNASADSPWTGPLWSFTTANFLIIDDFESYNDLDENEPGSNRLYLAWIDGFDNPAINGSVVGNFDPPFAEQTIVHSGNQSMPMSYDNSVGKSEATLILISNRDWTVNGVDTLTIWFRGDASNAAEQMYVTLNSNARIDHDNPDAATITSWTQWNIDLQEFADQGVNLTNVSSITIGLSSVTGGTGKMYFDDIRLYPPAP
jgi:hypothetical protein